MPKPMPATPRWLRAGFSGKLAAVDREKKVLRGYVLAQEGPFKSAGRGEFDRDALQEIVRLGNAKQGGLKSRFAHPSLSDDGIGKFLGRAKDLRLDRATDGRTGKTVTAVRGDKTALEEPPNGGGKPLGIYVMDLTESDPDALSSSLVIVPREEFRKDAKGRLLTDDNGEPLPALWFPEELHASDIVDRGDAVDGLLSASLSADALPDAAVRQGYELLQQVFAGQPWEVVQARCLAYLDKCRGLWGGPPPVPLAPTPALDAYRLRLEQMGLDVRKRRAK
jgi:hypothetical protein